MIRLMALKRKSGNRMKGKYSDGDKDAGREGLAIKGNVMIYRDLKAIR